MEGPGDWTLLSLWNLLLFLAPFITFAVVWSWLFFETCPECGRRGAMKETGREKREFWQNDLVQSTCKYCGYWKWEEDTGS